MKQIVGAVIAIAIAFFTLTLFFTKWENLTPIGLIGLRGFIVCLGILGEIGAAYLVTNWERS